MNDRISFESITEKWKWWKKEGELTVKSPEEALLHAAKETDFFIDPAPGGNRIGNAPFLYTEIAGDCTLSVTVLPEFTNTYDAGGLLVMGENHSIWAKLAFEMTDLGYPAVVSVVTNLISDDANGVPLQHKPLKLQILRKDDLFAMHYADESEDWQMVRYFLLPVGRICKIGLISQSPVGGGNKTVFKNLSLKTRTPENMRSGKF